MRYGDLVDILRRLGKRSLDPTQPPSFVLGAKGLALDVVDLDGQPVRLNVEPQDFNDSPERFVGNVGRLLDGRKTGGYR